MVFGFQSFTKEQKLIKEQNYRQVHVYFASTHVLCKYMYCLAIGLMYYSHVTNNTHTMLSMVGRLFSTCEIKRDQQPLRDFKNHHIDFLSRTIVQHHITHSYLTSSSCLNKCKINRPARLNQTMKTPKAQSFQTANLHVIICHSLHIIYCNSISECMHASTQIPTCSPFINCHIDSQKDQPHFHTPSINPYWKK